MSNQPKTKEQINWKEYEQSLKEKYENEAKEHNKLKDKINQNLKLFDEQIKDYAAFLKKSEKSIDARFERIEQMHEAVNIPTTENNKMKLLVAKIDNDKDKAAPAPLTNEAFTLASEFHCETETTACYMLITKNSQLTDNEFSLLAGKLVMAGFIVEPVDENAEFDEECK